MSREMHARNVAIIVCHAILDLTHAIYVLLNQNCNLMVHVLAKMATLRNRTTLASYVVIHVPPVKTHKLVRLVQTVLN